MRKEIKQIGLVVETTDGDRILIHADQEQASGAEVVVDTQVTYEDLYSRRSLGPIRTEVNKKVTITLENLNGYSVHLSRIQAMLDQATSQKEID